VVLTGLCVVLGGCSSLKIETGQTREEAVDSSRERSSRIRSQWAQQVDAAPPVERVELLITLVEGVTDQYFNFGNEVKYRWQEAEDGRGEEVPASEMRTMIEAWSETQKPILDANDDNLEYTRRRIRETQLFDSDFDERIDGLCDKYYEVYSTVFFPTADLQQYRDDLAQRQIELDQEINLTQDALKPYR
jgi:hypothetical protein